LQLYYFAGAENQEVFGVRSIRRPGVNQGLLPLGAAQSLPARLAEIRHKVLKINSFSGQRRKPML
jgi:hypothetical protein